jgi:hypothetical protein
MERFVMRLGVASVAGLSGLLLTASLGLTACSSSSTSSDTSSPNAAVSALASEASAEAAVEASGSDTSGDPVDAATACGLVDTAKSGYMAGFTGTDSTLWNQFAEEMLTASSSATDPDLSGSLMNVAVAAQFTVTGLESGDDLTTAKGDFDTTVTDLGKVCAAQGAPLK